MTCYVVSPSYNRPSPSEQRRSTFLVYVSVWFLQVGDPKDNVRKSIRSILKALCKVYPSSKIFSFVLDGIKSKNSKQRAECLEELGLLIDFYGGYRYCYSVDTGTAASRLLYLG